MVNISDEHRVIKMSLTKDKWAFPKSRRFDPIKLINHTVAYEPKLSDFEKVLKSSLNRADQKGMGGSSPRFEYYSNRRKHGAFPSSNTYNTHSISTNKGHRSFQS